MTGHRDDSHSRSTSVTLMLTSIPDYRATIYTLNGNISLLDLVEPNETDRRKDSSHGKMRPSRKRRPRNIPFKFISSKLNFPVNSKARHSAQVSNDAYGNAAMVHSVSRLVDPYFPNMRMVIRLPAVYMVHMFNSFFCFFASVRPVQSRLLANASKLIP